MGTWRRMGHMQVGTLAFPTNAKGGCMSQPLTTDGLPPASALSRQNWRLSRDGAHEHLGQTRRPHGRCGSWPSRIKWSLRVV